MEDDEIVAAVIDALNTCRVPYMLVGSLSSNYYGIARSTHDADFVIQLEGTSIAAVADRLPNMLRMDRQLSFEGLTGTFRYVIDCVGTNFKAELFLLDDDPHNQERFERRCPATYMEQRVFLPTVEDVIITKVRWLYVGGRLKDRDEIQNVLAVQKDAIDWHYVHKWCDVHGTRALLDEIRASIPMI